MPSYIEPAVIDMNPVCMKPILFVDYDAVTKYNLTITYEDSTTKTVELVQGDKTRPYTVVFKKDGTLITVTGVPKIYEISEGNKFCDFCNRTMDSNDLLIELDCSSEYNCSKVRFYLKDLRDITDIIGETTNDMMNIIAPKYRIYLNGFTCETKIKCILSEPSFDINLTSSIMKLDTELSEDEYSDFRIYLDDVEAVYDYKDNKIHIEFRDEYDENIYKKYLNKEIKIVVRYFVKEIDHPVFDEFTIIPIIEDETTDEDTGTVLTRAVTTADMQYLGDGLKTALGVGLTPGYKEYRNSKNYDDSVIAE